MKTALDTISDIIKNEHILDANLRYCLINEFKQPYRYDDKVARPNDVNDFVDIFKLSENNNLDRYFGIGISIKASNISAIDIDKCFAIPFDINSLDDRAKYFIELLEDDCYIEFSFSGTGLRIFFDSDVIKDYSIKYYIKNEKTKIEFYQPSGSARYVTITGKTIRDNALHNKISNKKLMMILDKYMQRQQIVKKEINIVDSNLPIEKLLAKVKLLYMKNYTFQSLWFGKAPGSNSNESELDYCLLANLYENITQDKEKLKELFEMSPYYKSKDYHHISKWKQSDYRYFNYIYSHLGGRK